MRAVEVAIKWHPGLSVYASEPFLRTVSDQYGWLGGQDTSGNLRCVLPFTIIQKTLFRLVRFRVETIAIAENFSVSEETDFLNRAVEYFRDRGADVIIPATTNTIFRTYPEGAIAAPYGTYLLDLTQDESFLWDSLSSSHRRKIRLARKAGVVVRSGERYLDVIHGLVRDTFARSGMGFMDSTAFRRQLLGLGSHVRLFIAEHQGRIQGGMMVPFSDHSAYYVYGGSISEPISGAINLLHWEAIQFFRSLGVKQYDFVGVRINPEKGSKQEGLMTFKKRFGGRLVQGYMWKQSLNPLKYFSYCLAVRLLRGGDIVDLERHKLNARTCGNTRKLEPTILARQLR